MNTEKLSKRLLAVAKFVPQNARLADIGSDHAYLPTSLVKNKQIAYAVAGEVVKGPFESAKKQIAKCNLTDLVIPRLANGLDAVEVTDNIDTLTICGMGGALIVTILDDGFHKGKLAGVKRLILQANVGEKKVRHWVNAHGYAIIAEEILEENEKIYEIIVAEKSHELQELSYEDFAFGLFLRKEKNEIFMKKWQKEKKGIERVVKTLKKTDNPEKLHDFTEKLQKIEEVLS